MKVLKNKDPLKKLYHLEEDHWYLAGYRAMIKKSIERFGFTPFDKLLDVGCGAGQHLLFLNSKLSCTGLDLNYYALQCSKKNGVNTLIQASVNSLPFASESFQWVVVNAVLNCDGVDDRAAVKESCRVLQKGGKMILVEPAFDFLMGPHDRAYNTRERYSLKKLMRLLPDENVEILQKGYFNMFLFPAMASYRIMKKLCAGKDHAKTDLFPLWPSLNKLLRSIVTLEAYLLQYLRFPFGLSSFVVVEKKY